MSSKTPWRMFWGQIRHIETENLLRISRMFTQVIPGFQSHLISIQESRLSSKTPQRALYKHKNILTSSHTSRVLKFCREMFTYNLRPISPTFHSETKNVLQDSLKNAKEPKEIQLFQIIQSVYLMFNQVTFDNQSYLILVQKSKMLSKTPWRRL